MEEIPETAIFHIVIEEKVPRRGERIPLKADQISVLNTPNCLEFCLEFLQALWIVRVEPLDGNWPTILKNTFVDRA